MSSSLTNLVAKQNALKERKANDKRVAMEVDQIARKYIVDEDLPEQVGCFSRFVSCRGAFFHRRQAVATSDQQASQTAVSSTHASTRGGAVMARFVGKSKIQASENESARIEAAMQSVQSRLEGLSDRLSVAKQKAMAAQKAGRKEEALREMKKVKATQKQHDTVQMALEALERQSDALAQTSLQKELATTLASANKQMKQKSKGLLSFAEKAVDDAIEVADEAEDVAQVFEGLVPSSGATYDKDELKEELEAMMEEEEEGAPAITSVLAQESTPPREETDWGTFPAAPKTSMRVVKVKEDRQALLPS